MGSTSSRCGTASAASDTASRPPSAGHSAFRQRGFTIATVLPLARDPVTEMWTVRSAKARSLAEWKRRSGSFSRQCVTIWRKLGGTVSGRSGGSSRRMAVISSTPVLRSKGGHPARHSYSTMPKLKMSLRRSTGWPCTCSGDM